LLAEPVGLLLLGANVHGKRRQPERGGVGQRAQGRLIQPGNRNHDQVQ
jgi:hypothetical protein